MGGLSTELALKGREEGGSKVGEKRGVDGRRCSRVNASEGSTGAMTLRRIATGPTIPHVASPMPRDPTSHHTPSAYHVRECT